LKSPPKIELRELETCLFWHNEQPKDNKNSIEKLKAALRKP